MDKYLLSQIRYPDEDETLFDDRIPYSDAVEGLRVRLSHATSPEHVQETLSELQRRWAERRLRLQQTSVA
ncbi:MAG: hypothetical protein LBN05_08675 [Oscillospiraceae bacterium]|jgi:hypothetical protein|nr:hypothetical protein [Oscillospiraceae bacterium]